MVKKLGAPQDSNTRESCFDSSTPLITGASVHMNHASFLDENANSFDRDLDFIIGLKAQMKK